MNQETIEYYNKASKGYSDVRYRSDTVSFSQYLFKKRKDLFLKYLEKIIDNIPEQATILEIGCADGVLFKAIEERFPGRFSKFIGLDISPRMIDEARKQNINDKASFLLRKDFNTKNNKFDMIIELGVGNNDLDAELFFVYSNLKPDGYFFYSVSGAKSLYTNLKNIDQFYTSHDNRTYSKYEIIFKKYFILEKSCVYNIFIPKLWSVPIFARALQPLCDWFLKRIIPEFFHEKIYVFKKLTEIF